MTDLPSSFVCFACYDIMYLLDTKDKGEAKRHVMIEVQPEVYKKTIKKRSSKVDKEISSVSCIGFVKKNFYLSQVLHASTLL